MGTHQGSLSPTRANPALATLFVGMFVTGGTEHLVVGLLDLIAADLPAAVPEPARIPA